MMRSTRWLWLGLLAASTSGIGACDYFRPADPEPPSTSSSFLPDYSHPDSTLATIAKALADKGQFGATAYEGAFAESLAGSVVGYHHLFWPQDVADWSQLTGHPPPGDWGFPLEKNFYGTGRASLIQLRPDAYRMEWAPDPLTPDNTGGTVATIHRHYQLTTFAPDGTQTSFLAIGIADLTLLRFSDGNWRIVRWEDRRDPEADPNDADQKTLGRRRLNTQ